MRVKSGQWDWAGNHDYSSIVTEDLLEGRKAFQYTLHKDLNISLILFINICFIILIYISLDINVSVYVTEKHTLILDLVVELALTQYGAPAARYIQMYGDSTAANCIHFLRYTQNIEYNDLTKNLQCICWKQP